MKVLRFGIVTPAMVCAPVWLAESALAEAGFKLEWVSLGATHLVSEALAAGEIDLALSTPEGAIIDVLTGGPTRIVAGLVNRAPLTMVAHPRFQKLEELRGARLGTTSLIEGTRHIVDAMLGKVGLHYPADYEFVLAGAHPQRWTALQAGAIDAAAQMTPFELIAQDAGYSLLGDAEQYVPFFAFCTLNARLDWATSHRAELAAFLNALRSGVQNFIDDSERAAAILQDKLALSDDLAWRGVDSFRRRGILERDLTLSPEALAATVESLRKSELIDQTAAVGMEDVLFAI